MKSKIFYKNIFMYSSLQFCGNIEEYFVKHTEKLVVFIIMPRIQSKQTLVRLYRKGILMEEKKIPLNENLFFYYFFWYTNYIKLIFKYFKRDEKFYLISFHPLPFFFSSVQRVFRKIHFVYWIADYFPPINIYLKYFENLKNFYHNKVNYSLYLSDTINKIHNGKILDNSNRKTVMWGVKPKKITRSSDKKKLNLLFVGLIKESQGLELLYDFLKDNKKYNLKIVGVCEPDLYKKHLKIIKKYKISGQIYFPNKFFSDKELDIISKKCQIGVAFYDDSKTNATYYTEPGKIKAYTELGMPVVMSNTSAIAPFISRFKAGELVERNSESIKEALENIQEHYKDYLTGVKNFNDYFYFDDYYKKKFEFLTR